MSTVKRITNEERSSPSFISNYEFRIYSFIINH